MIVHTDPKLVSNVRSDERAPRNPYVSGYGRRIPTRWGVRYANRWHRVYVMCYSNAGSAYIRKNGQELFLDVDTEYRLYPEFETE